MSMIALLGLISSLFYELVVYYIGKILTKPDELRTFLGLKSEGENQDDIYKISYIVKLIGQIIMVAAIVRAITSIATTIYILLTQI